MCSVPPTAQSQVTDFHFTVLCMLLRVTHDCRACKANVTSTERSPETTIWLLQPAPSPETEQGGLSKIYSCRPSIWVTNPASALMKTEYVSAWFHICCLSLFWFCCNVLSFGACGTREMVANCNKDVVVGSGTGTIVHSKHLISSSQWDQHQQKQLI